MGRCYRLLLQYMSQHLGEQLAGNFIDGSLETEPDFAVPSALLECFQPKQIPSGGGGATFRGDAILANFMWRSFYSKELLR